MKKRTKQGFTLIELLVVITIIGILVGLAVPGVNMAIRAAHKAEAVAVMGQLQTAFVHYDTEYSTYPSFMMPATGDVIWGVDTHQDDWKTLYKVLTASTGNGGDPGADADITKDNSRRITFIEIPDKFTGTEAQKTILDPWGYTYGLALDTDYDHQVEGVPDTSTGTGTTNKNGSVALWCYAMDNPAAATAADIKKAATTWK